MLLRCITNDETVEFINILCLAFNLYKDSATRIFYDDPFFELSHKLALFVKSTDGAYIMASILTIIPSALRIGNANVLVGGIAGVATLPEHRKKGYAGILIKYAIDTYCTQLGYALTALHAEDEEFYSKLGFTMATGAHYWKCSPIDLEKYDEMSFVREADIKNEADLNVMSELYNRNLLKENNGAIRSKGRWHIIYNILPNRKFLLCCEPHITGYAHIENQNSSLIIHEMMAETQIAKKAILGYLSNQNVLDIEWKTTINQLNVFGIDPRFTMPVSGAMMYMLDVCKLLTHVYHSNFEPIIKQRNDALCLIIDNMFDKSKSCKISINKHCIQIVEDITDLWISLDIKTMVQLFTGYKSAAIAYETGNINISSTHALILADLLFPQRDPFIGSPDQF